MTPSDLTAMTYMAELRSALQHYRVPEHEEILLDLRNHVSEALGSGKPFEAIIAALGPPDLLARAYAMELLINPPKASRATGAIRLVRILGLVVAGGFFSLCITLVLGSLGLPLLAAGPVLFVGGILQSVGQHPGWLHTGPLPPIAVIAIGPIVSLVGAGVCWVLWRYVRMTARTLRKILPARIL